MQKIDLTLIFSQQITRQYSLSRFKLRPEHFILQSGADVFTALAIKQAKRAETILTLLQEPTDSKTINVKIKRYYEKCQEQLNVFQKLVSRDDTEEWQRYSNVLPIDITETVLLDDDKPAISSASSAEAAVDSQHCLPIVQNPIDLIGQSEAEAPHSFQDEELDRLQDLINFLKQESDQARLEANFHVAASYTSQPSFNSELDITDKLASKKSAQKRPSEDSSLRESLKQQRTFFNTPRTLLEMNQRTTSQSLAMTVTPELSEEQQFCFKKG